MCPQFLDNRASLQQKIGEKKNTVNTVFLEVIDGL